MAKQPDQTTVPIHGGMYSISRDGKQLLLVPSNSPPDASGKNPMDPTTVNPKSAPVPVHPGMTPAQKAEHDAWAWTGPAMMDEATKN
jgi:hypothetical protein